jgi:hypothetical protein
MTGEKKYFPIDLKSLYPDEISPVNLNIIYTSLQKDPCGNGQHLQWQ